MGVAVMGIALLAGCGPDMGAFLYHFGATPKQTVKAQYTLTKGKLLVLVDDAPGLDLPPQFCDRLHRAIRDEFEQTGINREMVGPADVSELRRKHADFDRLGIREVGRLAGAEQVVWVRPMTFEMNDNPDMTVDETRLIVAIKVINAKAESKDDLRLWPTSEDGHPIEIKISPGEVRELRTADAVLGKLATNLAEEVGRLFRDYDAGRPEDQRRT